MADSTWYFEDKGQKVGPFSLAELQTRVAQKQLTILTKVWAPGMREAVPAKELPMLFPSGPDVGIRMLIPVGRSGLAITAGYLGLLSPIPFVGPAAIIFSVLGIRDLRANPQKAGWGRVIFGLIMGTLFTFGYLFMTLVR